MGQHIRAMLKELEDAGYKYRDVDEIFKQKKISTEVVQIILKWLPRIYQEHLGSGDQLIRSLIAAEEPFDPRLLIDLFETSDYNFSVKSGMAVVLSYAKTMDVSNWIKDQLLDKPYSLERGGLVPGLERKGGFKSSEELMKFLRLILDKYPMNWLFDIYKKYADEDDVKFLEDKLETTDRKLSKEIAKLIAAIRKRKRTYKFPQ